MHVDPILYTTLRSEIGLQIFIKSFGLPPFGIHIITPSFCVDDNLPFLNPSFNDLTTKAPSCNPQNLKDFGSKAIRARTFVIFHIL